MVGSIDPDWTVKSLKPEGKPKYEIATDKAIINNIAVTIP
jgi:hypothetical protein